MFYAIAALAYNLMAAVKLLCLPDECQSWTVPTLLKQMVRRLVAGGRGRTPRRLTRDFESESCRQRIEPTGSGRSCFHLQRKSPSSPRLALRWPRFGAGGRASHPQPANPDENIIAKITPNAAQLSWLMIQGAPQIQDFDCQCRAQ